MLDPEHMSLCFGLPGMTFEETAASMTLFAREGLPLVRAFDDELNARRSAVRLEPAPRQAAAGAKAS